MSDCLSNECIGLSKIVSVHASTPFLIAVFNFGSLSAMVRTNSAHECASQFAACWVK